MFEDSKRPLQLQAPLPWWQRQVASEGHGWANADLLGLGKRCAALRYCCCHVLLLSTLLHLSPKLAPVISSHDLTHDGDN